MGDLPLVEETRQVGLHLGASGHSHAQREEAPQVFLHQGELVPIQPLLPGLLGPVAFLRRNRENVNIRRVASQRSNVLDFTASCEDTNGCLWRDTNLLKARVCVMVEQMSAHALLVDKPGLFSN